MVDVKGKNVFLAMSPYRTLHAQEAADWLKSMGARHVHDTANASKGSASVGEAKLRAIHALTWPREDGMPAYDMLLHEGQPEMHTLERCAIVTAKMVGIPTYDILDEFEMEPECTT